MYELKCENLTLGYDDAILVENLSFEVNSGDYLCIVGENGVGKSTLMKTILGLQKPISGEIIYGDKLLSTDIGYLPQQTIVQRDFPASVREVVLSGCQSRLGRRPFYGAKEKKLAYENMEKLSISHLAGKCYRELSGGQQQRVLLARALCATERLLLLDEPVAGLDPKVTANMYSLIKKLNDDGITIIMISHDIATSVRYANRILHLDKEVFFGSTKDYKHTPQGHCYLCGGEFND